VQSRRDFLGTLAVPAALSLPRFEPARAARAVEAFGSFEGTAEEAARDESRWFEVQQAFTVDRSQVNLNNGGVSPAPGTVLEAMKRHLDFSNEAPAHNMWRLLEPQVETVRQRLARLFGCDTEEMAITRNASEGLQICQLGFDLEPGDEVLTTDQDYPRMLTTFEQRARREGIVLKKFPIPVPSEDDDEIVRRFEQHITERTRLILMCHVINLTGQILPVNRVVTMARARGIPVIVDGAHSFAHFEFTRDELDCDYFGTSLHKWLFAPHGTGFLYVRKDRIADLWPMMAAQEKQDDDIRKFEEIGTHPAANHLAISEAIGFHLGQQGGAPALPAGHLGAAPDRERARAAEHQPRCALLLRHRQHARRGHRHRRAAAAPVEGVPHPDHLDPSRRRRRAADHAQRLHHAGRARPLLRRDRARAARRPARVRARARARG